MKTSHKIFGLTYLIAGMAVAGIAFFTLSRTTQTLHDLSRQRLHESVNREARIIYNTLDMVKSDLLVLAEEGGAGGPLDEAGRRKLSDRYAAFMQKRPSYTRILYQSGANGDLVSVEQTDQGLRAKGTGAAVDSDLSHMAEQGAKLWPGNVTLSAVVVRTVREEPGQIARVIYAATPVAAPATNSIAERAMPSSRARQSMSSSLALPFSGAAATRTRRRPSRRPAIPEREAPGMTLTSTRILPALGLIQSPA